jgi:hypothetical protein
MPVWAFEPEGETEDVLLSSGMLWGADLLIEPLRVERDDSPLPVPAALQLSSGRRKPPGRVFSDDSASYVLACPNLSIGSFWITC